MLRRALNIGATATGTTFRNRAFLGGRFMSTQYDVKKCSLEHARAMPRDYSEVSNDVLVTAALCGNQNAQAERLIREIMTVENVSWEEAQPIFKKVSDQNKAGMSLAIMPYRIGVVASLSAAFLSFPLVFSKSTALWFNENFVTTDVPPETDLETMLEVGSWTWNWMEPPLGQISFFSPMSSVLPHSDQEDGKIPLQLHDSEQACRSFGQDVPAIQ